MIEVKNLVKDYGAFRAVNGVSFKVAKGEILGFLGPNGAGKSTTMKIITGFMPATEGTATVAGFDVFENPNEIKKRIGYLPEEPPLYDEMTIYAYLKFVGQLKGLPKSQMQSRVDFVTEKCGLKDYLYRPIANLSKGYRQRVGIAQALMPNPEVLILDEPTVGLDPVQIIEIRSLIKELAKSHTIILSTHILPEVTLTCDSIVLINKGKVIAQNKVEALTDSFQSKTHRTLIEVSHWSNDIVPSLEKIAGVVRVSDVNDKDRKIIIETDSLGSSIETVAKHIVENNWGLQRLNPLSVTLEDIYLQLITGNQPEVRA